MRQQYLLHSIQRLRPEVWQAVLATAIHRADQVQFYLPGEDLELRQPEILALPGIMVTPWAGMDGAQMATGPVTPEARTLLIAGGLWSYELSVGGKPVLRVEDFNLCLFSLTTTELAEAEAFGIEPGLLEPVNLQADPITQPVRMTDDALDDLVRKLGQLNSSAKPQE